MDHVLITKEFGLFQMAVIWGVVLWPSRLAVSQRILSNYSGFDNKIGRLTGQE